MNNKFNNIILLSDMDGTLLDSKGKVSKENKKAIEYFIQHGGRFGVATGRTHINAMGFLKGVPINYPCIFFNGGMLYDFDLAKVLLVKELAKDKLVDYLRNCIIEFPYVTLHIYSHDMCYIVSNEDLADQKVVENHKPNMFCSIDDILDKPWIKILFSGSKDELKRLEILIDKYQLENIVDGVYSLETFFEILPHNVSKGRMIEKLRESMDEELIIYGIGDYHNDIEMLKAADIGIATENALEELKIFADIITVSNDKNAIADVIYNIII